MRLYILDRIDQVQWFVDPLWISVVVRLQENHYKIKTWIEEHLQGDVVISGEGKIPPGGGMYHPTEMVFEKLRANIYTIYFELDSDAVLFKLTWGGSPKGNV